MLKTNSKRAIENIRNYIVNGFGFENYDDGQTARPEGFTAIARFILATFREETKHDLRRPRTAEQVLFTDWCGGLPSVLDTCYYYNRSAVDDLGEILEETETERNRYTEAEAEEMLTRLIWRELIKAE